MGLPRVRFTVRRMMVAVAVMALILGAWVFGERRGVYLEQAAMYGRLERAELEQAERYESRAARLRAQMSQPVPRSENDTEERYQARVERWARERSGKLGEARLRLGELDRSAKVRRHIAAQFARLRHGYQRAASMPWLSVSQ